MEIIKSAVLSTHNEIAKQDDLVNGNIPKKKKILSEEEYTEKMEKIITRDFFPDLPKLKAQNEYLTALEKGDMAKIQEIQITYQPSLSTRSKMSSVRDITSSASFDTPNILQSESSPTRIDNIADDSSSVYSVSEKKKESLDEFLSKSTSEDNASFQVIMEKSAIVHQKKYPWLYKDENEEAKKLTDMLALPPSNSEEDRKAELVTWAYKNKNALMYVPDDASSVNEGKFSVSVQRLLPAKHHPIYLGGKKILHEVKRAEFTAEEKLQMANRKQINHTNTRFEAPPFDEEANKEAIAEAASVQAKMKEGKVGIDGKEIIPGESPQVNGYGFVGTPVPEPGVTDTPIMTWGEIEGTPFRLDGSDTPLPQNPNGQQFKIPNLSAREKIALSLADKVAKKHRKTNPINSEFKSPYRFGSGSMTPLEKLQNMSPAARRLACAKLGIHRDTDKALRASYSPSPLRTPSSCRTPSNCQTPATPSTPVVTPAKTAIITPNHTEALLNLPKRNKASDFF